MLRPVGDLISPCLCRGHLRGARGRSGHSSLDVALDRFSVVWCSTGRISHRREIAAGSSDHKVEEAVRGINHSTEKGDEFTSVFREHLAEKRSNSCLTEASMCGPSFVSTTNEVHD